MTQYFNEQRQLAGHDLMGETVTLGYGRCRSMVTCNLFGCTVKFERLDGRGDILLSMMKGCDIMAVEPQWGHGFGSARFIDCRFHGVFTDIEFGRPDDDASGPGGFGRVEGCDFTAATLDGCRFINTDMSTLKLPPWPHMVVREPHRRFTSGAAVPWPGSLGALLCESIVQPAKVSAVVVHVPTLAKRASCTIEQVRQALQAFGGVVK